MGTTTKRVLRGAAAVAGALALGTAFAGTATASPLGGLGGDGNDGTNEGPADFANFGSNNYHGDDYGHDSSMFGDGDSTPGLHNDLMNFEAPRLQTQQVSRLLSHLQLGECEAVSPVWDLQGVVGHADDLDKEVSVWASGHHEQGFLARGSLTVGERTWDIDGIAYRDHSWGPVR